MSIDFSSILPPFFLSAADQQSGVNFMGSVFQFRLKLHTYKVGYYIINVGYLFKPFGRKEDFMTIYANNILRF